MTSDRNKALEYRYGVTPDIYDSFLETQHGRCAICGVHQSELERRLFVDHEHKTKRIRGLLCYKCNTLLGLVNDNEELLKSAIDYLKERNR